MFVFVVFQSLRSLSTRGASSVLVTSAHPAVPGHGGSEGENENCDGNGNDLSRTSCHSEELALGSKAPDVHLEKGHLGVHLHGVNKG